MHSSTAMSLLLAVTAMLSIMGSAHAVRSLKWSPVYRGDEEPCWGSCPPGAKPISGSENTCRTMGCPTWLEQVGERCYWPCKQGFVSDGLKCKQTCPKGYVERGAHCQQRFRVTAKTGSRCPVGSDDLGTECWKRIVPTSIPKAERFRMHADVFPTCSNGLEMGWDGLCYTTCKAGFQGQGPLCVPEGQDEDAPGTHERGPGSEPATPSMDWCTKANGYELIGQTCYLECDPGFAPVQTPGSTPALCMEVCPEGYTDGGKVCIERTSTIAKSTLKSYTRGSGVPLKPVMVERQQVACSS